MFSDTWIFILSFSCIAWVAWILISNHRRVFHNPPLPPGPSGLPVVGSLPFLGPELHSYFANLSRTYGPLVTLRLGKKIGILVASPSTAKEVLKDFDITFANRDITAAGREATYGGSDIGWSPYGPEWRMLRKDIIVGGTDTTSNTLEFAMAEMMNKPEVMKKAQQELDTVLGTSNAPLEESHILHLPYLQAIVKETLRLHSALPLLIPHCPSESCIVGGYTIPKDSRIFVNVWAIHRDPSLWEDSLEFKPERFLDKRHDFSGNDFSYFPFGSGRRICAGITMADRMLLYSLASLLHCFEWKLPKGAEKVDLAEKFGITLKKRTPLLLIPLPRSSILGGLGSS